MDGAASAQKAVKNPIRSQNRKEFWTAFILPTPWREAQNPSAKRSCAGEKVKASDVADLKRKIEVEKATAKEARQDVRHQRGVAQEAKDERDRLRTEDNGAGPVNGTDLNVIPDLVVHDGAAFASSLDVARVFGKRPDHVVAKVDLLVEQEPECAPNFRVTSRRVQMPRGGFRDERVYEITRDGVALLAGRFTGAKAIRFQLAYIAKFNAMEAELKARAASFASLSAPPLNIYDLRRTLDP